ncbi:MAG: sigma 54-interacting transcriptional regulator [Cytophagales bacterium]|nr:sigma 54-interacting transcriptional regulator [Cytophagales bacterium]
MITHPSITAPIGSLPATAQTVLIVEDEFAAANNLQEILEKAGYQVSSIAFTVAEAQEFIRQQTPDLVLVDIMLKGPLTGIDLARELGQQEIPFVYVSANTNTSILEEVKTTQPCGFIVKPFREKDVLVALEIARYRHAHRLEVRLRQEHALQIALTDALSKEDHWQRKLLKVARLLQPHIPFDYLIMGLEHDRQPDGFHSGSFYRTGPDEYQALGTEEFLHLTGLTPKKYQQIRSQVAYEEAALYRESDFEEACRQNPLKKLIANTFRLQSNLTIPLVTARNGTFLLSFYSRRPDAYGPEHLQLLVRLSSSLSLTIDRLLAFDQIERLGEQLRQENTYLQEEVKTTANFEEIVGTSPQVLEVFNSIEQVAPTDFTVLILGETGTGKELFARAVHNRSSRKGKPLIKVNCAALPPHLVESELFGHERGSFTGATEKRIGKFELAHKGTIFLDEIGEMPPELQPKLLRVLQEKEIERVGGREPIPCDVRVIAATNRTLHEEVAAGRFRADLYYRLNVFPIQLPSLRERKEDLLPLATYFLEKITKKLGKRLNGLSEASIRQMHAYPWPGNIRELKHLLERAALMSTTREISLVELLTAVPRPASAAVAPVVAPAVVALPAAVPQGAEPHLRKAKPYDQAERENIVAALKEANYRIRGKGGAAEILRIKPTTLESKMARMKIARERPAAGAAAAQPDRADGLAGTGKDGL